MSGGEGRAQAQLLVAGRYRLLSPVGGGGMGAVWLARDQLLNRQVAIKSVAGSASPERSAERRAQALREGRMAAQLSHPHSVSVYDVAIGFGEPWLVMEYLPSRSLAAVVADVGPLPPASVAQIGAQIADALATAHTAGVVHRDVKPGNVLIGTEGRDNGIVKIADFGISRSHDELDDVASELITGTPEYFAPEVARGAEPRAASDVYSLGSTLYAAVEGAPPFGLISDSGNREQTVGLLRRVASGQFESPCRGGALTPVLLSMMEPDPRHRPSMAQARDDLVDVAVEGRSHEAVLGARTVLGPQGPAVGPRRAGAVPAAPARSAVTPSALTPSALTPSAHAPSAPAPSAPARWDIGRWDLGSDRTRMIIVIATVVLTVVVGIVVGSLIALS